VSARLGGGMGYRTPTVFTDRAEMVFYKNVLPVDVNKIDAEKSIGGNFDVTYKTPVLNKQGSLCINQLVFYTRINDPVELDTTSAPYEYGIQDGFYDTRGTEINIQLKYRHTTWAIGYTYADSRQHFNGMVSDLRLSAKHRIKGLFIYEVKNNFRAGFETYFTGRQLLSDGSKSDSYWICGILFEKMWKHVSVFANVENILNVRQSKYEKIYTGTLTEPTFKDIYAPLDGVVANVGLKVSL
jgi:iron complex outermembrane receptor protein